MEALPRALLGRAKEKAEVGDERREMERKLSRFA